MSPKYQKAIFLLFISVFLSSCTLFPPKEKNQTYQNLIPLTPTVSATPTIYKPTPTTQRDPNQANLESKILTSIELEDYSPAPISFRWQTSASSENPTLIPANGFSVVLDNLEQKLLEKLLQDFAKDGFVQDPNNTQYDSTIPGGVLGFKKDDTVCLLFTAPSETKANNFLFTLYCGLLQK